ncbi:MAG: hypothetical protein NHF97_00525, partial [Flavobacteriia bacterium]|nr:hypothetical protein [Candidatus Bostrichicola ureolyticus]
EKNNFNDDKLDNKKSNYDSSNNKLNLYHVYDLNKGDLSYNNDLKKINDNLDYLISNKQKCFFLKKMFLYLKFKINNFLSIFKKNNKKIITDKKKIYFKLNKDFDIVPIDKEIIDKNNNINNNNEKIFSDKIKNFDFNDFLSDHNEYFNKENPIIEHYKDLSTENINKYTIDPNNEYMFMDYESQIDSFYNDFEKEEHLFYENDNYDNKSENINNINEINKDLRKKYDKNEYSEKNIDMKSYKKYLEKEILNDNKPCNCVQNFYIKIIELINERDDYYKKKEKNILEQYKKNNVIVIK